jgi:hypothetical protein
MKRHFSLHTTFISFAMGWTSEVRQPIHKPIRIIDDDNNQSSICNVLQTTAAD